MWAFTATRRSSAREAPSTSSWRLQKVDLKPNLKKFQAYTTSPAESQAALSAEQKRWLKRTFIITDPILRSQVKHAETQASEAKAAAADAPPATKAEAEAEAHPGRGG